MKYLTLILVVIAITGCNNTPNKPTIEKDYTIVNTDSVEKAKKFKSTENIAYDKMIFGMGKGDFKKIYGNKSSFKIGSEYYDVYPAYTSNDKLYAVEINSDYKTANYIDADLKTIMDNLVDVISKKYGKPTDDFGEIDFIDFKPGYVQWKKIWNIGTKSIMVGMAEDPAGSKYKVLANIINQPLYDEVNSESSKTDSTEHMTDASKF